MDARTGMPTTRVPRRSPEPGTAASTRCASRAPILFAIPALRVGLVDDTGIRAAPDGSAAGGEIGGQRHVSAESDDHVGLDLVEDPRGCGAPTAAQPAGQFRQIHRGLARHGHRRDQLERVTALAAQCGLQTPRGARGR